MCDENEDCIKFSIFKPDNAICISGLCVCSDSFDGIDDWEDFGTCHINKSIRKVLRLSLIVFSAINLLLSMINLVKLLRKKQSVCCKAKVEERSLFSEVEVVSENERRGSVKTGMDLSDDDDVEGESEREKEFRKRGSSVTEFVGKAPTPKVKERKRRTARMLDKKSDSANLRLIILSVLMIVFCLSLIVYLSALEFEPDGVTSRRDSGFIVNGSFGLGSGIIWGALWSLTDFSFSALPK